MKYLLLFICLPVFAQSKKDNTITIPCFVPLDKIKTVLFQNGYVAEGDTSFLITNPKELTLYSESVKILIHRTDSNVSLRGLFKAKLLIEDFSPVEFFGAKKSIVREAWDELDKIAKQLSENIIYSKQ